MAIQPELLALRLVVPSSADYAEDGHGIGGTPKLEEAMAFLQVALARGPRPERALLHEARAAGIAPRTLIRAKDALHLIAMHQGWTGDGYWTWSLPETAGVA